MGSPCETHPETGEECPLRWLDKNNTRCHNCTHRMTRVKQIDGHKYVDPHPSPPITTAHCWWPECWEPIYNRSQGLCKHHYSTFHNGKISIHLKGVNLKDRKILLKTVADITTASGAGFNEVLIRLLDQGCIDFRKLKK